jgi:tetratricopeptide (TPR) repeat protein
MFDEAVSEYECALDLDLYHLKTLQALGRLYLQEGQHTKAIMTFKSLLLLDPQDKAQWTSLGAAYEETGDFRRAERSYREALAIDPYEETANLGLARAVSNLHGANLPEIEREDVIRRLDFVLSVNPHNEQAEELIQKIVNGV